MQPVGLPDNPPMHLLIPFANSRSPDCQAALQSLKLPNLDKLLRKLTLAHTDAADDTTLSPPHERALATALGISTAFGIAAVADGQIPFGAYHAAQAGHSVLPGQAWAVITPCHWTVQTSHITMTLPRALKLGADESRTLLAAMQPYFAEDGIALMYDTPTRWLARGEIFAGLATASPYRVVGGHVDDWLPKSASAKLLRRLQNEMQMLLYTHPLTGARAARGLPAVNSFWVSGTGVLPPDFCRMAEGSTSNVASNVASTAATTTTSATASTSPAITVPNTLRDAAVLGDWTAWAQAWQQIDSTECAALLQTIDRQVDMTADPAHIATLTLCGERSAQTYQSVQNGLTHRVFRKIRGYFGLQPLSTVLSQL